MVGDINSRNINGTRLTCLNYYAYMLQIRENSSLLLRGGRLLQQYVVDNYVKIETQRLRWIRSNQRDIRSELYQGLQDCLHGGENNAGNVGTRIVLPSSFVGSPRDMYQRYQDAMTLVQTYRKPDIMLTMTCNPNWSEIKYQLLPGQSPQDRPDLITRIFRSKFEEFKKDIVDRGILGKVCSYSYVIEYQKRGLPHVHMLVIFENNDKLCTPEHFDSIVHAGIPSQTEEPNLHKAVVHHMIHGPCGSINPNCPCMVNGKCKKNFPKPFVEYTSRGNDSYPLYRRREGSQVSIPNNDDVFIDNGWVVPYNPLLLLKYDCHINVEDSAQMRGLLKQDDYIKQCLQEACSVRISSSLRRLFVSILVFCQTTIVRELWDEFYPYMCEDYAKEISSSNLIINKLLLEIRRLHHYKKKLDDFDLPSISDEFLEETPLPKIIEDELSYQISDDDLRSIERLNAQQRLAFDTIIESIMHNQSKLFFIDGPRGTSKTFLYRSMLAHLRKMGKIIIAVATSGIAATLLQGGRTAHSRFQIPLRPTASTLCNIKK
ncbi:uncharacterized protein LOC142544417 [Primulina tabacum]|uniref:uncharacterized protein LOC142544417 n=1 Tax=Primulina tabacum TaxID=48773 RepID=UPI003F595D17